MFRHRHPYPPFIPEQAAKLIVGTLPPPRFSTGALKEGDVDFCYGSKDGQLWTILNRIFDLQLPFQTTENAIHLRKKFLNENKIGICDIVASADREKVDASDLGMQNIELRDLVAILRDKPSVTTLLFTGGNGKNGPEYLFRKLLKLYELDMSLVSDKIPRVHEFPLVGTDRIIRTVSLIAPSGAANRAIGSMESYKKMKANNPALNTIDFRVAQYRPFFLDQK